MKKMLLALAIVAFYNVAIACDTTLISNTGFSIAYVDSEELTGEGTTNGHAIHCIDGDLSTFWHTQWNGATPPYPHQIQINLGAVYPVNGINYLTRADTRNGRIKDFELYLSIDGINWNSPQAAGVLDYPDPASSAQQTAEVYFGAVNAQYIKLVGLSSVVGDVYTMLSELSVFQDLSCGATGQINQIITIDTIGKQTTTSPQIVLTGSSTSGLPIAYSIVSGPAIVQGNVITLTGLSGNVIVQAFQEGDGTYYPATANTSFIVIDLSTFRPTVNTKLTGDYDLQMPSLNPYLFHTNAAIDEPDFLSITSVEYHINGEIIETVNNNGDYQAWWTPPAYGNYNVEVIATGSNGNTTIEIVHLNVTDAIVSQNVQTFNEAVIDMGTIGSQWYYGNYTLPQSVGAYDKIVANFSVSCPAVPGGCDDWDRLGWVEFKAPDGSWIELFRYITPYRVACNHEIDVTDYASMLQGNIELRMYIETWGTGGWKINLDFDYTAGAPTYLYSTIEEMWHGTFSFGDPQNLQPMDTMVVKPYPQVGKVTFRLVTTGHGWGSNNTGNASEFYHATHQLKINNQDTFIQDLWTQCNPNPDGCTGQQGTWQYNRAGWCPGVIPKPYFYDLTPYMVQAPFNFQYIFQTTYQDLCHPHNPDCVSGVTCPDCNDGYNPQYRVGGYLFRFSNQPLVLSTPAYPVKNKANLSFQIYPNPSNGNFTIIPENGFGEVVCTLHSISGETLKTYFFKDAQQLASYSFHVSGLTKGIYFMQLQTASDTFSKKMVID